MENTVLGPAVDYRKWHGFILDSSVMCMTAMFFTCQSLCWTSLKQTPHKIARDKSRNFYFLFTFHNYAEEFYTPFHVTCIPGPWLMMQQYLWQKGKQDTDSWIFYLEVSDGLMLSFHWLKQATWFCLCSVYKKRTICPREIFGIFVYGILSTMLSSLFSWATSYCSSTFHRSQPCTFCLVHPQGWLILFYSYYPSQLQ